MNGEQTKEYDRYLACIRYAGLTYVSCFHAVPRVSFTPLRACVPACLLACLLSLAAFEVARPAPAYLTSAGSIRACVRRREECMQWHS